MFVQLFLMLAEAVIGFFTVMLLARVLMQLTRAPFRNPLGHLVIAVTDGAVRPVRRWLRHPFSFDFPSLLLAWLAQVAYVGLAFALSGGLGTATPAALGGIALLAVLETVRLALYLLIGVVIVAAALSWINPYSPVAPVFDALTHPFLAPVRRHLPLFGGVDLSPLVLLLVLQMLLVVLAWARGALALLPLS